SERSERGGRHLPCDARAVAVGDHADALARAKRLAGVVLDDGDHPARVEAHRHLDAGTLVGFALDGVADEAAEEDPSNDRSRIARAAADAAAGPAAERGTAERADARVRALELDRADVLDHAQLHRLGARRLAVIEG